MAERYTRLFRTKDNLYSEGSPVVIVAGALNKDNAVERVVAQFKLKNISAQKIKAATIQATGFDVTNKETAVVTYQYLDLSIERGQEFGAKTPVVFSNPATRSLSCVCTMVVFDNGEIWEWDKKTPWEPLPEQSPLASVVDSEYIKQYQIDTTPKSAFAPIEEKDVWICACGEINKQSEVHCSSCKIMKHKLFDFLEIEGLKKRKQEREQAAAEKAAQEQAEKEAKKAALLAKVSEFKKPKRLVPIVAIVAILIAICCFVGISCSANKEMNLDAVETVLTSDKEEVLNSFASAKERTDGDVRIDGKCGNVEGYYVAYYDYGLAGEEPNRVNFHWNTDETRMSVKGALSSQYGSYDYRYGSYWYKESVNSKESSGTIDIVLMDDSVLFYL